jgi:hypothetical protein
MGKAVLIAMMLAVLGGAIWFGISTWISLEGEAIPTTGYVAMGLGVFFSLIVGGGLMALVFYSSRHGYDDEASRDQHSR